jgi:hypothetical protein
VAFPTTDEAIRAAERELGVELPESLHETRELTLVGVIDASRL